MGSERGNEPLEATKIPDLDPSLVSSTREEVVGRIVPTKDIDIRLVRSRNSNNALAILDPDVPNANTAIGRTTRKHGRFARAPLEVLDRVRVAKERFGRRSEGRLRHRREEDLAVDVSREEAVRRGGSDGVAPGESVALGATVGIDGVEGEFGERGGSGGGGEEGGELRGDVEDVDFAGFGEGGDGVDVGRRGRAEGEGEREGEGADAVHAALVGDGAEVEDGVVVRLVV